jgi:hypothetical protein
MALIDCMNKLGKVLSKDDEALLQQWLDQGLTDDEVIQRYELHIEKKLVDITKLAQEKGATVLIKRDVLAEVRVLGEKALEKARTRLAEVRAEHTALGQKMAEMAWIEGNVKHWEQGGPDIDINDDAALLVRFHQMLFPTILGQNLRSGAFGMEGTAKGLIWGKDAYELRDSFRAMQDRMEELRAEMYELFLEEVDLINQIDERTDGGGITLDSDTGEYLMGPLPPEKPDGVEEESWNYTFSSEAPKPPFTLKTGKNAEGDLYIQTVGPNAGKPHRTRHGPSDMAISLDTSVLLPDYMFYLLTFLQPQMLARAHGTAQQFINKRDVEDVITKAFQNMVREDTGDFYADSGPTAAEIIKEGEANYKALVNVVEEREIATGITKVVTAHDAAHVLAEIRKNASEGFWALVLDKDNNVVGVVEHGRGTIDGTSVYPSTYAGAIHTIPGAAKVWMAHNHPSGVTRPSQADMRITDRIGKLLDGSDIKVQGHVLMGAGSAQFALMDETGAVISDAEPITPAPRRKRVKVFTRKIRGVQRGPTLTSPTETARLLDQMGNPEGVLMLNNRHQVVGFLSMTPDEMKTLKGTGMGSRLMRAFAETNAAAFMISTKTKSEFAANNMAAFANASEWRMLDAFWQEAGATVSGAAIGAHWGQNEFYQKVEGLHSGLMVAAQTMPQAKGPVDQMMALLKKQPGVSRVQKPMVDEDGQPVYEEGLPSKKLRVKMGDKTVDVLQNPTVDELAAFRQSIRMEYKEKGWSLTDDPIVRSTWDESGNRWVWEAGEAAHVVLEGDLARQLRVKPETLSQHNQGKTGKQVIEITYPELDFLQVEEYFEALGGTITQDQIIAYIRKNGIQVHETVYGGDRDPVIDLTTELVEVEEVYERYGFDPLSRFDQGEVIFSTVDFLSQRSYEIIYDPQTGTAAATPDEGQTWLPVAEPGPFMLRTHGQDQQMAAVAQAEASIETDIKQKARGAFAGPARFAGTESVLPGGKYDREIVLRTPKVPSGGVVYSGNLRGPSLGVAWTDDEVDNLITEVANSPHVGDVQINRMTLPNGTILNVSFENLAPEDYQDFADLMTSLGGIQITDADSNLKEQQAKLDAGELDEIQQRQVENFDADYWEVENVFAWIRTTDRVGPNGEKILFIEELQSNIHQAGARVGYRERVLSPPTDFEVVDTDFGWVAYVDGKPLQYGDPEMIAADGEVVVIPKSDAPTAELARVGLKTEMRVRYNQQVQAQTGKQPQAPFKGNAWVAVAIKRIIRLAAEQGYDQIGFITGEQTAIRNNQAEHITDIRFDPLNNELEMWDSQGRLAVNVGGVAAQDLEQHMSAERAEALRDIMQENNNRYEILKGIETDLTYEPSELVFFDGTDMRNYLEEDLKAMAEQGDIFVSVDVNGEYMRDEYGSIIIGSTRAEMHNAVQNQLYSGVDSDLLPTLEGLTEVTMTRQGEGSKNFYDSTAINIARGIARKLDRDARVELNGTQINTREGAPFTVELQKTIRPGQMPGVDWYLLNDEGRQVAGPFAAEQAAKNRRDELNNITATIHVMDMTPTIVERAMEGMTFYQKKRGAISFDEARRGVIKLTETRDLSTFMHEAGHLYLEIMGGLAEDPNTPQQIKDDYAKILEYLGVSSRDEIGREQHEHWAESFEKYLHEGRAPSVALQSAFNAYRRWLTDIWKRMRGETPDGIVLTPEIRGVMDRILASDDQIAVANATQEFSAVFSTAEQMGVTQREFEVYKAQILTATNEAIEKETQRLMAHANRERLTWYKDELAKVRAKVEAEAWEMKVYQAFFLLAHGTQPNGEPLEQGSPFKLEKASLLELLQGSKDTLKRLPKPWVYTVKGGVDVDAAAKTLGYTDGMALVTALMEMPPMKDWIEVESKARMEINFPDPLLDGSVSENAIIAVHNEARANVLATEMRALRKLMKEDRAIVAATKRDIKEQATLARLANKGMLPKRDELKIIKQFAKRTMGELRIMDVRPEVYLNAERKAGRLAFEAAARGDYQNAYNLKRQQTVNHELYRAAVRAKEQAIGWRNYLAKFSKPRVIQRLGKLGVIEPILAVLEGVELKKVTLKSINRKAALQKLAQQIHDGQVVTPIAEHLYRVEIDDNGNEIVVLNEAPFKNWQEMTVDELHAMRDIVKQLEHQGKRKLEMPVNGEMVVLDEAITEITEQVLEVNEEVDIGVGTKGLGKRIKKGKDSGIAHWLGPSVMANILDKQGWGATTRLIIVNIRRAIAEKLIPMQRKAISDMNKIYLKFYATGYLAFNTAELKKLEKGEVRIGNILFRKGFATINGESLSKGDVLSLALHMGNEGNKSAVFNGIRIDDRVAYPEDQVMAALAKLDSNDWAFVQAVWDYLDSYWPALSAMERERRGIAPEKVEHVPFTVEASDGVTVNMKGGYMPLAYNYEHSERHEERIFEDHYKNMSNSSYLAASTRAGATHNRVKNHNMVVQLGLFQIEKHLKEITRDIAIGDEVNFANNLLQDKGYRKAMKKTGNALSLRELELWLTDAAVGELPANNMIERRMAWVRVGFTISKLAFNVYTTVLQLTGIFQSMVSLGSQAMAMGAGRMLRNPVTAWTQARDASPFLRARYGWNLQAFDKDIHDAAGMLSEYGTGLPTTRRRVRSTSARLFFLPIAKMQQVVDVITWWGAIWKGQNKLGLGEDEAVHYADAQVELGQTSGFFSDRSGIERGTLSRTTRQSQFIRLWTTLISYMQRKGNLAYMKTQELKEDMSIINATLYAVDMLLLFTAEGIASAMLYNRWDWEEDDPEEIAIAAAKATLESIAAGIPFVREYQSAIYGSGNTPLGGLGNDLVTLYIQAMQGEMDPALREAFVKSFGTIFHLPASQTNRMLEALIDEDDPEILEYFTGTRD